MKHFELPCLLLASACISHVFGGLLPPIDENQGYQYNRPNDVFRGGDLGRRGFEPIDRFGGFGNYDGRPFAGFRGRPSDLYGPPGFGNYPGGGIPGTYPGYQGGYQGGYNFEDNRPRPYSFQYEVRDPPSGNDYGQRESSDGNVVRGEYRVLLPDSRTQIVKYTADDINGYNADVRYEGQAQFPRVVGGGTGFQGGFGTNAYQQGRGGFGGYAGGILGVGAGNQYLPPVAGGYGK